MTALRAASGAIFIIGITKWTERRYIVIIMGFWFTNESLVLYINSKIVE